MKNYKNLVWFGDGPLDRCLALAKEFDSLTEAKKYASRFANAHVALGDFSKDDGSVMYYKEY